MKSVLISGYYGFGNLGDEAILAGMLSCFRELAPDVSLTVLSASPSQTEAMHSVGAYGNTPLPVQSASIGVHRRFLAIPRANPFALLRAIRDSDLFVSGGGGLIQDKTSQKSLLYYLGLLFLAQRRRCKTMIMAQGIGPLLRPSSRWLVEKVLQRTDAITVRDDQSALLLQQIAPDLPSIEVTADLAFALPLPTRSPLDTLRSALSTPHSLSVSLRPWPGQEKWLPEVASALNLLSQEDGLHPLLIPLHAPPDRELMNLLLPDAPASVHFPTGGLHNSFTDVWRRFAQKCPYMHRGGSKNVRRRTFLNSPLDETAQIADNLNAPEQALHAIGQTEMLLGMRLHSLIFAAMMGAPCVALAYDPKVEALAKSAAMPCLPLQDLKAEDIVSAVRALLPKRQEEGQRLLAWAAENRTKARRNVELALRLLMC